MVRMIQCGRYWAVVPSADSDTAIEFTMTRDYELRVSVTSGSVSISGTVAVSGNVNATLTGGSTLADDMANPTASLVGAFAMAYDGATWDRVRSFSAASATLALGAGAPSVVSAAFYFDSQSGTFRRVRCDNNGLQYVTNGKPVIGTQDQITKAYSPDVTAASIKTTQAQLFSVVGSNNTAAGAFLCVVNKTSAPVNTDTIYEAKWCPAGGTCELDSRVWGLQGENLSAGLGVCWSTTATTVTLPGAGTGFAIISHYT